MKRTRALSPHRSDRGEYTAELAYESEEGDLHYAVTLETSGGRMEVGAIIDGPDGVVYSWQRYAQEKHDLTDPPSWYFGLEPGGELEAIAAALEEPGSRVFND